nr:DUF6456 domain-containing protein [uncultured Celeribacter sp.]
MGRGTGNHRTEAHGAGQGLPAWVPQAAKHYLAHTERGDSIRALARRGGCAPSTVMRQVRKIEQKRDDPLIDELLTSLSQPRGACDAAQCLGSAGIQGKRKPKEGVQMSAADFPATPDDDALEEAALRVLQRLSESGACLAVARDMERAVVVRDMPDGRAVRTAVLDRQLAQAMALKDWIVVKAQGKITRYVISASGRAVVRRLIGTGQTGAPGFGEAPMPFVAQDSRAARVRYHPPESPVMVLARRRLKNGDAFLGGDLVAAAERLREDFELSRLGAGPGPDWGQVMTDAQLARSLGDPHGLGAEAARARLALALAELGPGLGDVTLRCCCYLEGMEQIEKRMGWAARSGKVVLRIALQRLAAHFKRAGYSGLVG